MEELIKSTIEWLIPLFEFYEEYKTYVVILGSYLVNPMFTFFAVQKIKRTSPAFLKRRMLDAEVQLTAYPVSWLLSALAFWALIPDATIPVMILNAILISLIVERSVNRIMKWAKKKHPDLYVSLKNDAGNKRRKKDPAHPMNPDNLTEFFGADATLVIPDDEKKDMGLSEDITDKNNE